MYRKKKNFHIASKKGHWRCSPTFGVTKNLSKLTVCLSHQSVSIRCHQIVPDRDLRSNVLETTLERSSTRCVHSLSVHEPLVSQHTLACVASASVRVLCVFRFWNARILGRERKKLGGWGGEGNKRRERVTEGFLSPYPPFYPRVQTAKTH